MGARTRGGGIIVADAAAAAVLHAADGSLQLELRAWFEADGARLAITLGDDGVNAADTREPISLCAGPSGTWVSDRIDRWGMRAEHRGAYGHARLCALWHLIRESAWPGRAPLECSETSSESTRESTRAATRATSRALAAIDRLIRRTLQHALARTDPSTRALAGHFVAERRYRMYRWMMGDPTGRLRQLARVCPGALAFAADLQDDPRGAHVARALIDDVIEGVRLPHALRRAVEGMHQARATHGAAAHPAAMTDAAIFAHCRLIRHAGARLLPGVLLRLHAEGIEPGDLPAPALQRWAWLSSLSAVQNRACATEAWQLPGFRRFLPASLASLRELGSEAGLPSSVVARQIADYVTAVGRVPGRRSAPRKLLHEAERWARTHPRGASLARGAHDHPSPESQLPPAPRWPWVRPGVTVRALTTRRELFQEGAAQRNCLADRLELVVAGSAYIYVVTVGHHHLTVQLGRAASGHLFIMEASGDSNRRLKANERRVLADWLKASKVEGAPRQQVLALASPHDPHATGERAEASAPSPPVPPSPEALT